MIRVGAADKPLTEQGQIFFAAPLAPQGGQPPQHPGKRLHVGGGLSVVGGEVPQVQPGDAAADDGGGGAVPRLLPLGEAQVPAAHAVLRDRKSVV